LRGISSNSIGSLFTKGRLFKLSLPSQTVVSLKVYDILGNEVTILVDEEKPAGNYEVNWNATNHPSGIYFYSLTAGSFL